VGIQKVFFSGKERTEGRLKSLGEQPIHQLPAEGGLFPTCGCSHPYPRRCIGPCLRATNVLAIVGSELRQVCRPKLQDAMSLQWTTVTEQDSGVPVMLGPLYARLGRTKLKKKMG